MKNRLSQSFYSKYSIKNLNVMKVWKITNKPKKIIFDNNYEFLIDLNNKFGDEKKYYDFFFLFLEDSKIENITKKMFDNFIFNQEIREESEEKINNKTSYSKEEPSISQLLKEKGLSILSTHMDKLEEFKLTYIQEENKVDSGSDHTLSRQNKSKTLYTVICKCFSFENLIKKSFDNFDEENNSFSDLEKSIQAFGEKKPSNNNEGMENCILEIQSKNNKEKLIYITKNKTIFIPEYLLEYNYVFNNLNININSLSKSENKFSRSNKLGNIYNSSYINKEINSFLLKDEYIQIFNNSLKNLINCEIKKYVPQEIVENFSSCKFQFLDEMNSTELFYSKNTILNFVHTSHKYSNSESFNEEFNKILEKLEEIKNLNFRNPLITINSNKMNSSHKKRDSNLINNSNVNKSSSMREISLRKSTSQNPLNEQENSPIYKNNIIKTRNVFNNNNINDNHYDESKRVIHKFF